MRQSTVAQLLFLCCSFIDAAPTKSAMQVISPLPGYVPVFIRKGDQPLEEINQQLAEAFVALEAKSAHAKEAAPRHQHADKEARYQTSSYSAPGAMAALQKKILQQVAASAHIQKIPKHKN